MSKVLNGWIPDPTDVALTGKLSVGLISDNARDDLCFIGQTT